MRLPTLAVVLVLAGACGSAGPSRGDVLSTWRDEVSRAPSCEENVNFSEPEIIGTTINENRAEVLLRAVGEWKEVKVDPLGLPMDPVFMGGPCNGFHPRTGTQAVQHRMIFTKFDTGWHYEGML